MLCHVKFTLVLTGSGGHVNRMNGECLSCAIMGLRSGEGCAGLCCAVLVGR